MDQLCDFLTFARIFRPTKIIVCLVCILRRNYNQYFDKFLKLFCAFDIFIYFFLLHFLSQRNWFNFKFDVPSGLVAALIWTLENQMENLKSNYSFLSNFSRLQHREIVQRQTMRDPGIWCWFQSFSFWFVRLIEISRGI